MAGGELSLDNPVFRMYIGYAALVCVKTLMMAPLTAYHRLTNKAFGNEEDTLQYGGPKKLPVNTSHPQVERVRRCHYNDIENIIIFCVLGLLYVASGPTQYAAALHFRIFVVTRYLHTVVYLCAIRQPFRALCFMAGLITMFSMSYNILKQASF